MVWSPIADEKFLGYVEVNPATMEIEPRDPSRLKEMPNAPSADDTGPSTTTGTDATGPASASDGNAASSAGRPSETAAGPGFAPTAG